MQHSRGQSHLRARLQRANSQQLLELIAESGDRLRVGEALLILRNAFVTAEAIEALLVAHRLLASYRVRSAIARHRRTPEAVALRFISGLFWRDLLEITLDVRIRPAVRRVAEKYLVERLRRLAVGEKVAVARRAPGGVLEHLLKDPSLLVIKALLANPRLTEPVLMPMLLDEKARPRVLDLVARDPRWGTRYEVRLALGRNPQSPFRAIFEILPFLRSEDLTIVAEQDSHSWVVRHRAREVLSDRGLPSTAEPDALFDRSSAVPIKLSSQTGE